MTSKLRLIGRLSLMPRMLALSTMQRQTAASRSARPWMSVQHGFFGGLPRFRLMRPLSTLAHTASLRVSMGHLPVEEPGLGGMKPGLGGVKLGLGGVKPGLGGLGVGPGQTPQPPTRAKKRRLKATKRAADAGALDAMAWCKSQTPKCDGFEH